MQEIDAEAYEGILKKLARQKYTTLQDDDALVRKQKLLRYLAGKGYEAHLCHQMADYVLLNH
jgi:SOS response regulatory protein OraA/RecX